MSYIGNQITAVPFQIDVFSGNASQVTFGPLVRAPTVASIAVFISGVYKTPGIDYTVDSDYITFTSAPASGTNNIVIHHIGNGFMATQVPGDGTVTTGKIVAGSITGNLIGTGAISGNNVSEKSINASNSIVELSVTGNLIGTGAISGNNFAGGAITSNILSSNLSLSTTRVFESANINDIGIGGNVNIDVANNSVFYFNANTTANITFNLRANTQNTFDSITTVGQSVSVAMIVKHGTIRHTANLYIDGGLISSGATPFAGGTTANALFYAGNTAPNYQQSIVNAEVNTFGYTILKMAANSYHVIASNTLCKLG